MHPPMSVSPARRTWVLTLLAAIWVLNYFDRNMLNALLEPIKAELKISDTMLGLMTGFGFVLLFSAAAIPLARLADRGNRVAVISGGLTLWSVMTMVSGAAGSAVQLLLCRSLVGIGEATSAGPTQALLSDYYEPEKRGRVMSILAMCTFIGILLAFVVGGAVNASYGWRAAFLIAGAPGLVLAILCWLTVRDLPRGATEQPATDTGDYSIAQSARFLIGQKCYVLIVASFCSAQVCSASLVSWVSPYLQRVHGLDNKAAGLAVGPVIGFSGIAGALICVAIVTRLIRRDPRWQLWAPAITMLATVPALLLFCFAPTPGVALAGLAFATMCSGFQPGPIIGAVQSLSKVRSRAVAAGFMLAAMNLIGWGLGPLVTGLLSDILTPRIGPEALRYAMLVCPVMIGIAGLLALAAARFYHADVRRAAQARS